MGTDVSDEICGLAETIYEKYPTAVFFGGQIVFPEDTVLTRSSSTIRHSPCSDASIKWESRSSSCPSRSAEPARLVFHGTSSLH